MARFELTYRAARRLEWLAMPKADRPSWAEFNGKLPKYHIGSILRPRRFAPNRGRSKYMPHIGAKQRAKGASA